MYWKWKKLKLHVRIDTLSSSFFFEIIFCFSTNLSKVVSNLGIFFCLFSVPYFASCKTKYMRIPMYV
jgi:hypothetical protein